MTYLYGTRVRDVNVRLRILLVMFFGTIAFASVLFWRGKALLAAEYVEFPSVKHLSANLNE